MMRIVKLGVPAGIQSSLFNPYPIWWSNFISMVLDKTQWLHFTAYFKVENLYVFAYFGIWSGNDFVCWSKYRSRTIKACQKGLK